MVAVMALGVTACGGSEPAADDAAKTYIIATDTTFAPFEFQNEAGEFVGIDLDLLAAIAEDQGFEYDLQALRRMIGVVPQKAVLFTGTIAENLRWADENASDEQLQRAMEIAQAADFVGKTQYGMQTHLVQGGRNLSGGQKQRLTIARAPYTSLMDLTMTGEDFTFAGVEQALTNGLTTLVATARVVGLILILILLIALGWNYFKLLLETVERYIVVGVLCYTSPLAFSMGASKSTSNVFKSWCRMVGSQLLLLVMNVWFLRGFAPSMGQFIGNGGPFIPAQHQIGGKKVDIPHCGKIPPPIKGSKG